MLSTVATVVIAVVGLLGAFGAGLRWFYKRAGNERALVDAVDANTRATDKLTESMTVVGGTLNDHEYRIKTAEHRLDAIEGSRK
jgi:uncharacterized membrane protein YqiK